MAALRPAFCVGNGRKTLRALFAVSDVAEIHVGRGSIGDAHLRLGVYDFDSARRPAWLCLEVAQRLEQALSKELATSGVPRWESSTDYSKRTVAFNERQIDIAFFDKLGPV